MNKCSLCGREISSDKNCFGLICLNKMRTIANMKKVSNIKKERELDLKVQIINWKWFLNKNARKLLTNRYLTYIMLKSLNLNNNKNLISILNKDIKSINNKTTKKKI